MKNILSLGIVAAVLGAGAYYLYFNVYDETRDMSLQGDANVEIRPIEHASFVLRWGEVVTYVDPVSSELFSHEQRPNLILITDIHGDHFSTSTLATQTGDAQIVAPQAVVELMPDDLKRRTHVLNNDESFEFEGLKITAIPAYNLPDAENADRHVKGRGNGYIIERTYADTGNTYRIYIAGDTAATPEMRALTDINVAFLPMNLPYTMSVEEAADAVLAFKPKLVYPYHFRTPEGYSDVLKFRELVMTQSSTTVTVATWYPNDPEAPSFERPEMPVF